MIATAMVVEGAARTGLLVATWDLECGRDEHVVGTIIMSLSALSLFQVFQKVEEEIKMRQLKKMEKVYRKSTSKRTVAENERGNSARNKISCRRTGWYKRAGTTKHIYTELTSINRLNT